MKSSSFCHLQFCNGNWNLTCWHFPCSCRCEKFRQSKEIMVGKLICQVFIWLADILVHQSLSSLYLTCSSFDILLAIEKEVTLSILLIWMLAVGIYYCDTHVESGFVPPLIRIVKLIISFVWCRIVSRSVLPYSRNSQLTMQPNLDYKCLYPIRLSMFIVNFLLVYFSLFLLEFLVSTSWL